ncbi:SDR family NAD(P)-dependent oxidoreductase [Catenuloplanes japonicus]|uniref:SDR family NAD(P)-dependent oxidoreductase n=1 Tax=Catenuloplanes japonicus TaxID=33876 RepID=UPI00052762D8|nr:SDR family NAD(P)-dependent oxidoreductase [Catenuloplanes japonicus]
MAQTVLITGSSSGIGRRAAERFLAEGWNVVATLRDPSAWDGIPDGRLLIHALDVRDEASVEAAVAAGVERFGRLDCVVNNAGAGLFAVFEGTPQAVVEDLFETNVYGPMRVIRAALPHFHRQGGGRIVNVTSTSATVPQSLQAVYTATKSALDGFSEAVDHELRTRNVDVKIVVPGFVPSTNFVAQNYTRFAKVQTPPEYASYLQQRIAVFDAEIPAGYVATEVQAAAAVFEAATDTTGRLRFRVGQDAFGAATSRRLPDADYESWRRSTFDTPCPS